MKIISKPEFKNASSRNRWLMRSALNSIVSRKISVSGMNVINVPVPFALPMTSQLLDRFAPLELHVMHFAAAGNFHLEPFADRVDALRADAVGAAGKLVAALTILAARVQRRQHHLHAGNLVLRMNVHRNAAPVVADRDRAIHMNRHLDLVAMPGEMFVHGIVQHLAHAMMQRALIRAADIHARLLAHGFQAFQLAQLRRAVIRLYRRVGRLVFTCGRIRNIRHKLHQVSALFYPPTIDNNSKKTTPTAQRLSPDKAVKNTISWGAFILLTEHLVDGGLCVSWEIVWSQSGETKVDLPSRSEVDCGPSTRSCRATYDLMSRT